MTPAPFLHIIVGPTASGKEGAALALARAMDAEIVSVDSMKIYRGLDIGTAKPSTADRAGVRHHGLDLIGATEDFSVARYVAAADAAIADIARRGRAAILSGGTALYYKGLLEGLFEGPGSDAAVRARWEAMADSEGVCALAAELARRDPAAARKIHPGDRRRLVRALEIAELTGRPISEMQTQWRGFHGDNDRDGDGGGDRVAGEDDGHGGHGGDRRGAAGAGNENGKEGVEETGPSSAGPYRYRFAMAWLDWPRAALRARIDERLERMRSAGLVAEARRVWEARGDLARTPLQAVAYKEFFDYFAGAEDEASAWERLRRNTARLAKAQTTWFRRFPARRVPMEGVAAGRAPEAIRAAWMQDA